MLKAATIAAISGIAVLLVPVSASVHAAQPRAAAVSPDVSGVTADDIDPIISRIEFAGGTFTDLLAVIGEQIDLSAINLVLKSSAAEMPVEALRLRDVNFAAVLRLILPQQRSYLQPGDDGRMYRYTSGLDIISPADSGRFADIRPIYVVTYNRQLEPGLDNPASLPRTFRLLSLAAISADPTRGPHAVEVFLDLVSTLMTITGQEEPELDYHEPSGMLVAHVTQMQAGLLAEAHESFFNDERRRIERLESLRDRHRLAREMNARSKDRVAGERRNLEIATEELDRVRALIESGSMPTSELSRHQSIVEEAKERIAEFERERDSAAERIDEIEAEVAHLVPSGGRGDADDR